MTLDLAKNSSRVASDMQFTRVRIPSPLLLASDNSDACSGSSSSTYSSGKRKLFLAQSPTFAKNNSFSSSTLLLLVIVFVVLCDLTSPVYTSPLPSSSAWSLPTLNYLFKDTKTQSNQYKKENENGQGLSRSHHHSQQQNSKLVIGDPPSKTVNGENAVDNNEQGNKVSSTGRLISAHDIRLTDNWGWVRRGASDPQTTTEQRRKQNIRHSKSKHKQRHHFTSASSASSLGGVAPSSSGSSGGSGGGRSRKRDKIENLLCPFDEIRGPDGKCRKAPRFSLYRVGRK